MIPSGVRVFVALEPIDVRCSFDRFAGAALERAGYDAPSGAPFALHLPWQARRRRAIEEVIDLLNDLLNPLSVRKTFEVRIVVASVCCRKTRTPFVCRFEQPTVEIIANLDDFGARHLSRHRSYHILPCWAIDLPILMEVPAKELSESLISRRHGTGKPVSM